MSNLYNGFLPISKVIVMGVKSKTKTMLKHKKGWKVQFSYDMMMWV